MINEAQMYMYETFFYAIYVCKCYIFLHVSQECAFIYLVFLVSFPCIS